MSEGEMWFGVRCLFGHKDGGLYEERVTIWPARSMESAIELAEREAEEYAAPLSRDYLGLAQAYGPVTGANVEDAALPSASAGTEVFSLMRASDLEPDEYIKRFFATGTEHQGDVDRSNG
jgi:hypothetical protein